MGTGASVPPTSARILDRESAQQFAGPVWDEEIFAKHAKDHVVGGQTVHGISREDYIRFVADRVADGLGESKRTGPFWDRVNALYLFMDGSVEGIDGKVTVEELKVLSYVFAWWLRLRVAMHSNNLHAFC